MQNIGEMIAVIWLTALACNCVRIDAIDTNDTNDMIDTIESNNTVDTIESK